MSFPVRQLGRNGPQLPELSLGLMGLSAFYGPLKPEAQRLAFLDRALELGYTFWDSADIYGDSEDLLGRWFKATGNRDKIFLATKYGAGSTAKHTREHVTSCFERSLRRLGTDYIDLYYIHRVDKTTPIEDVVSILLDFQRAGRIKHIGISESSGETLRRASKVTQIAAYQVEYSPAMVDIEHPNVGALQACRENGIAVLAYAPLGRGILTGSIRSPDDFDDDDFRRTIPRYSKENFGKSLAIADKMAEIAKKKGTTTTQLALAWSLAQGKDIFPLFGTTRVEALEENIKCIQVELTKSELEDIRALVDEAAKAGLGERYSEAFMQLVFADTPAK